MTSRKCLLLPLAEQHVLVAVRDAVHCGPLESNLRLEVTETDPQHSIDACHSAKAHSEEIPIRSTSRFLRALSGMLRASTHLVAIAVQWSHAELPKRRNRAVAKPGLNSPAKSAIARRVAQTAAAAAVATATTTERESRPAESGLVDQQWLPRQPAETARWARQAPSPGMLGRRAGGRADRQAGWLADWQAG